MDTKLKSSHRLGVLIIILAILLSSGATIGFYPYMSTRARVWWENRQSANEQTSYDMGNVAVQVMNFSYELWHQQRQEEEGRRLTYSETFMPGLKDRLEQANEYTINYRDEADSEAAPETGEITYEARVSEDSFDVYYLQSMIEELGISWESLYRQYYSSLSYAVLDENGRYGRTNVMDPETAFSDPLTGDEMQFKVHFSSSSVLKVEDIKGTSEEYNARLKEALSRYEFYDPVAARMSEDYRDGGVEFSGPKDMTILFRCSPDEIVNGGYSDHYADAALGAWAYLRSEGYYIVAGTVIALLTVLALALPCVKRFEIGKSALCRLSFEPLCFIGIGWLCIMAEGSVPAQLIASTMDGSLKAELLKAEFLPWSADIFIMAVNLAFWAAAYGMYYWGITCLRAFFSLGPWRYFKERTWLGKFLRFIKRWLSTALDIFNETDWDSRSTKIIGKAVIANFIILTLISCLWFWGIGALIIYSVVLFFMLKKYWVKMQGKYVILLRGINQMAEGDLDVTIEEDLGIFNPFKEQLSRIQEGFKKAVAQEVKSERTKSELITNVSHDLKTPLTAIITYVNLLKREDITKEERESYIQVLDRKSMRLKVLIEDLFEVSKASSGTVTLHLEQVNIVSLLKQVRLELSDKIESSGIEFRYNLPKERLVLELDSQKTYRIFENLLVNITKYGMPGTRAYVTVKQEQDDYVTISMRNISAKELSVAPEELTERFVRGDVSRNTEGAGLGLAIARSFVEVQGGTMEIDIEDDLFKVTIRWKGAKKEDTNIPGADKPEEAATPLVLELGKETGKEDKEAQVNPADLKEFQEFPRNMWEGLKEENQESEVITGEWIVVDSERDKDI